MNVLLKSREFGVKFYGKGCFFGKDWTENVVRYVRMNFHERGKTRFYMNKQREVVI